MEISTAVVMDATLLEALNEGQMCLWRQVALLHSRLLLHVLQILEKLGELLLGYQ